MGSMPAVTPEYLRINGLVVSVPPRGTKHDRRELGKHTTAFDGTPRSNVRGVFNHWLVRVQNLPAEVAEALSKIIHGLGEHFGFDASDLDGSKKTAAVGEAELYGMLTPDGAVNNDVAFFGDLVQDNGSIGTSPSATNNSAVVDTDGDAANWINSSDAPIADTSEYFMSGAGAVRIDFGVAAGTGTAYSSALVAASSTAKLVGSCYLRLIEAGAGGNKSVIVRARNHTNSSIGASQTIELSTDAWVRVRNLSVTGIVGFEFRLQFQESDNADPIAFAIDQIMVEDRNGSESYDHTDTSSAAISLFYDVQSHMAPLTNQFDGVTINAWAKRMASDTDDASLFSLIENANPDHGIGVGGDGGGDLFFWLGDSDGNEQEIGISSAMSSLQDWYMVTAVAGWDPLAQTFMMKLYVDGVLVNSLDLVRPWVLPTWPDLDRLYIGYGSDDTEYWAAPIDGVQLLPFVVPLEIVSGWHELGASHQLDVAQSPLVRLTGQMIRAERLATDARGSVLPSTHMDQANSEGEWKANVENFSLRLREKKAG